MSRDLPDLPTRVISSGSGEVVLAGGGAAASAWLVVTILGESPVHAPLGFAVVFLVAFFVLYRIVVGATRGTLDGQDRVMTFAIYAAGVLAFVPLAAIVGYVTVRGLPTVLRGAHWNGPIPDVPFLTHDTKTLSYLKQPRNAPPPRPAGVYHAIVGTVEQVGIATVISVPLAVLTAVFLNELGGPLAKPVRFVVEAMSGVPSIIAGLFIYVFWRLTLHHDFSGVAAAFALCILMVPTITRTIEEVLRTISDGLREAALALGAPEWRMIVNVVLPTARSGIITAVILGIARAVGETAPVLLTAFGSPRLNSDATAGPQADLPLFVYNLIRQPSKIADDFAWGGLFVLMAMVLLLFLVARVAGNRGQGQRGGSRPWVRLAGRVRQVATQ